MKISFLSNSLCTVPGRAWGSSHSTGQPERTLPGSWDNCQGWGVHRLHLRCLSIPVQCSGEPDNAVEPSHVHRGPGMRLRGSHELTPLNCGPSPPLISSTLVCGTWSPVEEIHSIITKTDHHNNRNNSFKLWDFKLRISSFLRSFNLSLPFL